MDCLCRLAKSIYSFVDMGIVTRRLGELNAFRLRLLDIFLGNLERDERLNTLALPRVANQEGWTRCEPPLWGHLTGNSFGISRKKYRAFPRPPCL